jgi:hypothetical protein
MKSDIWLDGEWVTAPKFAIGDAVAHCYHGPNDDDLAPDKWPCIWYRGIVIGAYYNRVIRPKAVWECPGWVYVVEIEASSEGDRIERWQVNQEEFREDELKQSRRHARAVAARIPPGQGHRKGSPPPPVLIARCKAG